MGRSFAYQKQKAIRSVGPLKALSKANRRGTTAGSLKYGMEDKMKRKENSVLQVLV